MNNNGLANISIEKQENANGTITVRLGIERLKGHHIYLVVEKPDFEQEKSVANATNNDNARAHAHTNHNSQQH